MSDYLDDFNVSANFADSQEPSSPGDTGSDDEDKPWYAKIWEDLEPARTAFDTALSPFDIVAGDHWADMLKERAAQPGEWGEEIDKSTEAFEADKAAASGGLTDAINLGDEDVLDKLDPFFSSHAKLIEAAYDAEHLPGKLDAFAAFQPQVVQDAAENLSWVKGASGAFTGLGILSDASTIISPEDGGAMAWVDRGAAGLNAGLLGASLFVDTMPVVGEVSIAATGIYLASDFVYHHWNDVEQFSQDIGQWEWDGVKEAGQLGSDVGNWAGDAASTVSDAASSAWDGATSVASSAWHDATSWL